MKYKYESVIGEVSEVEAEEEVNAMLESLTENQRDIVEAIHFSGMNMSEYAEKVGITKQAARERIHWAMKKLRKVS